MIKLERDDDGKIINISSKIDMFKMLAEDSIYTDDGMRWEPTGKFIDDGEDSHMIYANTEGFEDILPSILSDLVDTTNTVELLYDDNDRVMFMRTMYYYEDIPIQPIVKDFITFFPTATKGICSDGMYHTIYVNDSGIFIVD